MGPVAAAGYLLVTTAFLDAAIVGAFGGAIAWAVKRNRLWVGLLVIGGYLAATVRISVHGERPDRPKLNTQIGPS